MSKKDSAPKPHFKTSAEALIALNRKKTEKENKKAQIKNEIREKAEKAGISSEEFANSLSPETTPKPPDIEAGTEISTPEQEPLMKTQDASPLEPKQEDSWKNELELQIRNQEQLRRDLDELIAFRQSLENELAEALEREAQEEQKKNIPTEPTVAFEPQGEMAALANDYALLEAQRQNTPLWKIGTLQRINGQKRKIEEKARKINLKPKETESGPIPIDDIEDAENALSQVGFFRFKAKKELKQKIEAAKKERKALDEIAADKKQRAVWYYAAEKITNPYLIPFVKNKAGTEYDIRWADTKTDKGYSTRKPSFRYTENDEGFYEFNLLGFALVIKNVSKVLDKNAVPQADSPNAIYKVVGPDGTIVEDNIKGYDKADEAYIKAVETYRKKIEQEFNALQTQ